VLGWLAWMVTTALCHLAWAALVADPLRCALRT
jgi:hypothetical protein